MIWSFNKMKPSTFFKKFSDKINSTDPQKKKELFCKSNLSVLKKISEYCKDDKKVMVITDRDERAKFYKVIKHFELSVYYTRRGWAVFFTNFKKLKFTKIKDDRFRFLSKLYPKSGELRKLTEKRNKFFKDVLK